MSSSTSSFVGQPSSSHQNQTSDGPVAILWDIENCPVPSDVRPEDVGGNIRMALQVHPKINGAVLTFAAYGDFNNFPRRLREGCQRTGVKLVDVPNGRKDAADKAILVDMFMFAIDNPPPSSIMLISGDVDFAPALHTLGQRGYTIILVIPSNVGVSSALCNAGKFVRDWQSVARGEGFVPSSKCLPMEEEEAILYRGSSQSYHNLRDFSLVSQSLAGYDGTRSQSLPNGLSEGQACLGSYDEEDNSPMWVQPGDINGLKLQLVKLLELSGGGLSLNRVPSEYQKLYGRPLHLSEYGACKLVNLFKKMNDVMAIEGKGLKRFVYILNCKAGPSAPPVSLAKKDRKRKGTQETGATGVGSSDEFSDEDEGNLLRFKNELQEILVSYSCCIWLKSFEAIYQQRYKKSLDLHCFGVTELEELFEKLGDVVVLREDPISKEKFVDASGG
ncbi:Meiosis regulator and mRNA stability factor 1 [Linum grandiflorum]